VAGRVECGFAVECGLAIGCDLAVDDRLIVVIIVNETCWRAAALISGLISQIRGAGTLRGGGGGVGAACDCDGGLIADVFVPASDSSKGLVT